MIRAIIVDDEPMARNTLEKMLKKYFPKKVQVVELCDNVRDASIAIKKFNPNLVFLDIEMPEENGFRLFEHLDQINFEVIFTTAYKNYAIDAIKVAALDYVLKPVNFIDLKEALERFENKYQSNTSSEKIDHLIQQLQSIQDPYGKIAIPTFEGFQMQDICQILYCEADQSYTWIFTTSGQKVLVSKSLGYMEGLLPAESFIRIHKSHLVNIKHIQFYSRKNGNQIILTDGSVLSVAARRNELLVKRLKNNQAEN